MRVGIEPREAAAIVQHLQKSSQATQPLPAPTGGTPFRLDSAKLGLKPGPRKLYVMGDSGGISDPHPQEAVARAMVESGAPDLTYSVGDVVYYNGQQNQYVPQFFEPYAACTWPFVAIPGNHDGDPEGEPSLAAFMRYFCSSEHVLPPEVEEYHRDTQVQPNCYWTLADSAITIIGLYSNVPSGGVIEQDQADWLVEELKAAPTDRPLAVALHHPPYSADTHHGGSAKMGEVLDKAFEASGRCPQIVLSGHVHNYQRFTRAYWGKQITYVVVGNSGYHNRHAIAAGAVKGTELAKDVTFEFGDDTQWGFLALSVDGMKISGSYVGCAPGHAATADLDSFTIG